MAWYNYHHTEGLGLHPDTTSLSTLSFLSFKHQFVFLCCSRVQRLQSLSCSDCSGWWCVCNDVHYHCYSYYQGNYYRELVILIKGDIDCDTEIVVNLLQQGRQTPVISPCNTLAYGVHSIPSAVCWYNSSFSSRRLVVLSPLPTLSTSRNSPSVSSWSRSSHSLPQTSGLSLSSD